MSRKEAREEAFKIIYEIDINQNEVDKVLKSHLENYPQKGEALQYIEAVVRGCYENIKEIDAILAKATKSWTLKRINKVNLALMRLAIYEILKREDIPESISIFEAVELAKKYDSDEAGGFVNGILRSITKEMAKEEE